MKTHTKKEMKKHPYKKVRPLKKQSIIAQAIAYEQRKRLKLNNYAIIDENNNIIEKFRLNNTALVEMNRTQRRFAGHLRVCRLNEHGKVGVVIA